MKKRNIALLLVLVTMGLSTNIYAEDSTLVPTKTLEMLRSYEPAAITDSTIYCTINSKDTALIMNDSGYYHDVPYEATAPKYDGYGNKTDETFTYTDYRYEPNRVVEVVPYGHALKVIGKEHGWVMVEEADGKKGYIEDSYVDFQKGSKPDTSELLNSKGLKMTNFAMQFLGTPYLWGGNDLKTGVDCSGFVHAVFSNFGVNIARQSALIYNTNGYAVENEDLKVGDLLFFDTGGTGISHVAMYIGNGKYIQSTNGSGICVADLNSGYSQATYVGAKRVL